VSAAEAEAAAQLIERLLADPGLRTRFRQDPGAACREAGLERLADEMALGAGKAMMTLEIRESRSSLAGVMMAAAMESMGVYELSRHVLPHLDDLPPAVADALSRVDLPAIRGALAGDPPRARAVPAEAGSASEVEAAAEAAGLAGVVAPPAGGAEAETGGEADAGAEDAADGEDGAGAEDAAEDEDEGAEERREEEADEAVAAPAAAQATPVVPVEGAGDAPPAPAAPAAPAERIDPGQYGGVGAGTGGPPDAQALALLKNKRVILDEVGIADVKAGRIDPRVIAVLTKLSQEHKITVSCMCSDHSKYTAGGSISNHYYGRGLDIAAIDGVPVNAANFDARELATDLQELPADYRPNEIGTPWAISGPGYFTDAAHQDHLHIGFKQAISPTWQPPADLAPTTPPQPAATPTTPATTPSTPPPQTPTTDPNDSLAFRALPTTPTTPQTTHASQPFLPTTTPAPQPTAPEGRPATAPPAPAPAAAGEAPDAARGDAGVQPPPTTGADSAAQPPAPAGADAAADAAEAGGRGEGAGPRALAALAEARRHLGTPYLWGGSTPETGFDCSGLVQWAYAKAGIRIPRVTDQQILASNGAEVARNALIPGDLVFFRDESGYVYHVGMSLGGDRFLHAPRTGDVVKVSSLDEPYFAQRFTGARRFDAATDAGGEPSAAADPRAAAASRTPAVDRAEVASAERAAMRDAAEAGRRDSMLFMAVQRQETRRHAGSLQFLKAIDPKEVRRQPAEIRAVAAAAPEAAADSTGGTSYPGDGASKEQLAKWLAAEVTRHGLPPELPVMAALVESGVANLRYGHADSVGFFQMRVGIWNRGPYAGYPDKPELQVRWFVDTALAVKRQRIAAGRTDFGTDPAEWGEWIADIERPAAQYRGRYQPRLEEARRLLS